MDAEIGDEARQPALLHRTGDDIEHGGPGNQQQHQGGADEQADIRRRRELTISMVEPF